MSGISEGSACSSTTTTSSYNPTAVCHPVARYVDAFHTPGIPDASRKILAFGLQFKPTKQSAWDVGYAHVFIKDAPINRSDVPLNGNLVGTYKDDVNILSVRYSHVF